MTSKHFLCIISFIGFLFPVEMIAQGFNHAWLIGNEVSFDTNTTAPKARLLFNLNNSDTLGETRKMAFSSTEASISDANGNFLFATNGCWIMNASGDTMLNGSGINPGPFTGSWNSATSGLPIPNGAIILTFPGDSNKFVMFHQTGSMLTTLASTELYYSIIDMTAQGGLGTVINNQKNLIAFQDTLSWGLAACKHANGRDWWIISMKDGSNIIYKVLFTPNGISSVATQLVIMPIPIDANAGQPCFSPDGTKFAYTSGQGGSNAYHDVRIFSFDRCTGMLDSIGYKRKNGEFGWGLAFSPNSKYLYYSSFSDIYQLNTNAVNIGSTNTLVATYDGYCYPYPSLCTDFWLMYLAANSKIYITSSNYVIDLHYINSPDSGGVACDVHQHDLRMPCYTIREGINHPNYYLGPVTGSVCDSLGLSIQEINHDFRFLVYPNPVLSASGGLNIGYLLPQNKSGLFEIYDVTGKVVFNYTLPPWSNEQSLTLPELSNGLYNCVITSENVRVSKKVAVIKRMNIKNILGQTVFLKEMETPGKEIKVDLSFMEKGIYLVEVVADGERMVRKIVKE